MNNPDLVFVVGAPRSGTTWLQLLLAQHPSMTSCQETHLFPRYISPLLRTWREEKARNTRVGLTPNLDEDAFYNSCRSFLLEVAKRARKDKPGAITFVEKTPNHGLHGKDILQLFPDAWFIHIVRDPRAVVASVLDASKSWGAGWAEADSVSAAREWCNRVTTARDIAHLTNRYIEVRYEELCQDTAGTLHGIFDALGIDVSDDFCARAAEACSVQTLKGSASKTWAPTPMNGTLVRVARVGNAEGWREELSRKDLKAIEWELGKMMLELSYPLALANQKLPPIRIVESRLKQVLAKVRHHIFHR